MKGCIPLTAFQVQAVSAALPLRDRALFLTGIFTGFRISELLSLRICDVWTGESVRDTLSVRARSMKGNAPTRCIALHASAKAAIGAYLSELGVTDIQRALFPSRKGGKPLGRKAAWRILHSALVKAGVQGTEGQLGTHVMRKTFAGRMYDKLGKDLVKTQRALGHKSIQSTAQYLSFNESEITAAVLAA